VKNKSRHLKAPEPKEQNQSGSCPSKVEPYRIVFFQLEVVPTKPTIQS